MVNGKIPGVSVEVKLALGTNLPPIRINGDCYCGEYFSTKARINDSAILSVPIASPQNKSINCFTTDKDKNIELRKSSGNGHGTLFNQNIALKVNERGVCHTRYPNNNLRLIKMIYGGRMEIWEIALVSQNGSFFAPTQKTYEAKFYWDKKMGKIVCPRFDKNWPQIVEFGKNLLNEEDMLEPIEKHESDLAERRKNEKEAASYRLAMLKKPNTGYVLWWSHAQGYGAIKMYNYIARVHWKEIFRCHLLAFLSPGEIVKYSALRTPNGKTSFRKEAVGVMPVG